MLADDAGLADDEGVADEERAIDCDAADEDGTAGTDEALAETMSAAGAEGIIARPVIEGMALAEASDAFGGMATRMLPSGASRASSCKRSPQSRATCD